MHFYLYFLIIYKHLEYPIKENIILCLLFIVKKIMCEQFKGLSALFHNSIFWGYPTFNNFDFLIILLNTFIGPVIITGDLAFQIWHEGSCINN